MPISLVEGKYITVHPKDFVANAIKKGFGRVPTAEEIRAREEANGNMELDLDHDLMIMKYYAQVSLGLNNEYLRRVQGDFEVVAVSSQFKMTCIEHNWGYEPTQEEIQEKYSTGEVPRGYELVAIERDLISTLGDWQKTVGQPVVQV